MKGEKLMKTGALLTAFGVGAIILGSVASLIGGLVCNKNLDAAVKEAAEAELRKQLLKNNS